MLPATKTTNRVIYFTCVVYAERLKRVNLHSVFTRTYFIFIRPCLRWSTYRLVISLSGLLAKTLEATRLSSKKSCSTLSRSTFFSERVVNVYASKTEQGLTSVHFAVTVKLIDFSAF